MNNFQKDVYVTVTTPKITPQVVQQPILIQAGCPDGSCEAKYSIGCDFGYGGCLASTYDMYNPMCAYPGLIGNFRPDQYIRFEGDDACERAIGCDLIPTDINGYCPYNGRSVL